MSERVRALLADTGKPRLGISSCLLGERVRYNGEHKRDPFLVELLGAQVSWVGVCPEVELGLGVPRLPVRLEANPGGPRLIEPETRADHTRAMAHFSRARVHALRASELAGYVFKARSPSCGISGVPVWRAAGRAPSSGQGRFVATLCERMPLLPIEDEEGLADVGLRVSFIERACAYRRLRLLFRPGWTSDDLQAFHSAHALQLLAHSPRGQRRLGRLLQGPRARSELRLLYEREFTNTLLAPAIPRRHARVLAQVLARLAPSPERSVLREIRAALGELRAGTLPAAVPQTLLAHYAAKSRREDLNQQSYLRPHPVERLLRSRI